VTLFRHPILTLTTFGSVAFKGAKTAIAYLSHHKISCVLAVWWIGVACILYAISGKHQYVFTWFFEAAWWIFLGFLSSFGLGTGLHTFVLYLGPFIAQCTLTASRCGTVDFPIHGPSKFSCLPLDSSMAVDEHALFFDVFIKVLFQSIMWGIGTAIGELPPYFVARAARLSGQKLEDLDEITDKLGHATSLRDKLTKYSYELLQRFGFWGILMFASIPNPLFDLAGLTSGHFLMPFSTFFSATVVGKGFIKVTVQTVFVIVIFLPRQRQAVVKFFAKIAPTWEKHIEEFLNKQQDKYRGNSTVASSDTAVSYLSFSHVWNIVLGCMISFFVISLINSTVQHALIARDEKRLEQLSASSREKSVK